MCMDILGQQYCNPRPDTHTHTLSPTYTHPNTHTCSRRLKSVRGAGWEGVLDWVQRKKTGSYVWFWRQGAKVIEDGVRVF